MLLTERESEKQPKQTITIMIISCLQCSMISFLTTRESKKKMQTNNYNHEQIVPRVLYDSFFIARENEEMTQTISCLYGVIWFLLNCRRERKNDTYKQSQSWSYCSHNVIWYCICKRAKKWRKQTITTMIISWLHILFLTTRESQKTTQTNNHDHDHNDFTSKLAYNIIH